MPPHKKIPGTRTAEELKKMRERYGAKLESLRELKTKFSLTSGEVFDMITKRGTPRLETIYQRLKKSHSLNLAESERIIIRAGCAEVIAVSAAVEVKISSITKLESVLDVLLKHEKSPGEYDSLRELKKDISKRGNRKFAEEIIEQAKKTLRID